MYRFCYPFENGKASVILIEGNDLATAFDEYRRYFWLCSAPGAVGVWRNAALVAKVLPVMNDLTGELEPFLYRFV